MLRYFPVMAVPPSRVPPTKDDAHAGARSIVRLFDAWELSDREARELLGGICQDKWSRWKEQRTIRIGQDLGVRLSLLLSIHSSLRSIYIDKSAGNSWVKTPSPVFEGITPLHFMTSGTIFSLARVRNYLLSEATANSS